MAGSRTGRARVDDARPPAGFPPLADDDPDDPVDEPRPRRRPRASVRAAADSAGAVADNAVRGPSLDIDDGAGFLFGLLLYALALNFLRHGPAGVKSWLKAKLLNKPDLPRGAASTASTPTAGGNPVRVA